MSVLRAYKKGTKSNVFGVSIFVKTLEGDRPEVQIAAIDSLLRAEQTLPEELWNLFNMIYTFNFDYVTILYREILKASLTTNMFLFRTDDALF